MKPAHPKEFVWIHYFCILGLLFSLFTVMTGCTAPKPEMESRREFDYVPPVLPTPVPLVEEDTVQDEVTDSLDAEGEMKRKGFFARLFSGDDEEEDLSGSIQRVGDRLPPDAGNVAGEDEAQQPSENVYRIKTGDTITINLSGSGGLNEQIETVVDDEGAVKLRFIGAVQAEGLTTTDLEREIELEYIERQKIYRNLTARVIIPNSFYFIGGEVRQPGRFPIIGRVTLSQAIVAAGNFTEWANDRKIFLVRNNERVELDFRDISRNPQLDVELLSGDVVTVTRSTF